MFDLDAVQEEIAAQEFPCLEPAVTDRALKALETCLSQQKYGVFAASPEPNDQYPTPSGGECAVGMKEALAQAASCPVFHIADSLGEDDSANRCFSTSAF